MADKNLSRDATVVYMDVNRLKYYNDNYGHGAGDELLKATADCLREAFEDSSTSVISRIGGDEFVVILKNKDYKKIDKRIENFNYQIWQFSEDSSLEPWEKISAAIGYAKFDKETDKTVQDVFKRADRAMYDRKESMKANRDY